MTRLLENKDLDKNGFLLVKEFFRPDEIAALCQLFDKFELSTSERFFTTHWLNNQEKREVHDKLKSSIEHKIKANFPESEAILYYYLVKYNDANTKVTPHQDWTIIDKEMETDAFTLWIPLKETNEQNGGLRVVPQSHRILTDVRGSHIEMAYGHIAHEIDAEFGQNLNTEQGDAVIFNHKLLHSSPPNLSASLRLAIGVVLIPKGTQCVHYYLKDNKIYKYQVPADYLLNFSFGDTPLPSFSLEEVMDYKAKTYSSSDYQNDLSKLS